MMNYGVMGGGFMAFGWLFGLLVLVNLVLGAVALLKYINKE